MRRISFATWWNWVFFPQETGQRRQNSAAPPQPLRQGKPISRSPDRAQPHPLSANIEPIERKTWSHPFRWSIEKSAIPMYPQVLGPITGHSLIFSSHASKADIIPIELAQRAVHTRLLRSIEPHNGCTCECLKYSAIRGTQVYIYSAN